MALYKVTIPTQTLDQSDLNTLKAAVREVIVNWVNDLTPEDKVRNDEMARIIMSTFLSELNGRRPSPNAQRPKAKTKKAS